MDYSKFNLSRLARERRRGGEKKGKKREVSNAAIVATDDTPRSN